MPVELIAFTADLRIEGRIPLADDRLSDMLNAVPRVIVRGASVQDLVDGGPPEAADLAIPVGSIVADELLKLLDCKEQKQAADATNQALEGGVGTEVKWTSESRKNVTGSSKVTGSQKLADGTQCMTVTDVVIIDGEETTVPKKMCRGKGDSGYRKA